jgi:hypothetical protein
MAGSVFPTRFDAGRGVKICPSSIGAMGKVRHFNIRRSPTNVDRLLAWSAKSGQPYLEVCFLPSLRLSLVLSIEDSHAMPKTNVHNR